MMVHLIEDHTFREFGNKRNGLLNSELRPGPGGGDSHMKQTGMLVGNFEFNP